MAYLLGNKACMDSLQTDVQDLQWTVSEIVSRVGPVQAQSWKFPDKKACDLDIDDLLDLYDCDEDVDDAEERQVAHIALYELVIDRLVLVVQAISKFCSVQLGTGQLSSSPGRDGDVKVVGSIGLVVKEYWSHMVKLQTQHKQLSSEIKSKNSKITALEAELGRSHSDHDILETVSASSITSHRSSPPLQTPGTLGIIPPNTADMVLMGLSPSKSTSKFSISCDTYHKSCQTYESAFVPCESCDVIQRKMREGGDIVIKVCTEQGLPCSLKKFRSEVTNVEMLTFHDVCRWMAEQNKDIARIGKQHDALQSSIKPLKSEVKKCEQRTKAAEEKAETCEKNMKIEAETRTVQQRQYETKLKDQQIHYQELMEEEERQKRELKRNKAKLEEEIQNAKVDLEKQKESLKDLEVGYKKLESDLEEKKRDAERAGKLAEEVVSLKSQLADVTSTLENHTKTLAKEQGKSKSASKHNESLQAKQESLLSRMELLGRENEDLSQQVASLEEEKSAIEDLLAGLKVETKELRKKVKENQVVIRNLQSEKENLEQSIKEAQDSIKTLEVELEEARERERMIVEYPDLNGPVNKDLQGSGDIAVDMQNQVTANAIRIRLLQEQNQGLTESIRKISSLHRGTGSLHHMPQERKPVEPVPLWQLDSNRLTQQHNNNYAPPDSGNSRLFDYSSNSYWQPPPPTQPPHHLDKLDSAPQPPKIKQYAWEAERPSNHTTPTHTVAFPTQEFLVTHGNTPRNSPPKGGKSSRQGRPSSAKMNSVMTPVNATPIAAYTQMKKALGILSTKEHSKKDRPPSGRPHSAKNTHYIPGANMGSKHERGDDNVTPFSCPRCDKLYLKARDYDIHMTYCSH